MAPSAFELTSTLVSLQAANILCICKEGCLKAFAVYHISPIGKPEVKEKSKNFILIFMILIVVKDDGFFLME